MKVKIPPLHKYRLSAQQPNKCWNGRHHANRGGGPLRKNSSLFPIAFILTALLGINAPSKSRGRPAGPSTAHEIANHPAPPQVGDAIALQGTALLSHPVSADLSVEQRQQIIHYFLAQIAATPGKRDSIWRADFTSATSYRASVGVHRDHLRSMLGLVATHLGTPHIEVISDAPNQRVEDVTLPTDSGLSARALIFVPQTASPAGAIIAIPPATESREEFAGVMEGDKPAEWLLTLLARNLVVAVPITIERRDDHPICRGAGGERPPPGSLARGIHRGSHHGGTRSSAGP